MQSHGHLVQTLAGFRKRIGVNACGVFLTLRDKVHNRRKMAFQFLLVLRFEVGHTLHGFARPFGIEPRLHHQICDSMQVHV